MTFCWNCGAEVERTEAKFCLKCGVSLSSRDTTVTSSRPEQQVDVGTERVGEQGPTPTVRVNTYRLGKHFEENVASIFERMGYQVEMRHHFREMGGAEFDLLLTRGKRKVADECKNYDESRDVGIKEIRDFMGKLEQIKIVSGIFVAATLFSDPAKEYANSTGIKH